DLVRGPVLRIELRRFAAICLSDAMEQPRRIHAEFDTSSTCSTSTTGFCPSEDIALIEIASNGVAPCLSGGNQTMQHGQFGAPEHVGLSHNRFGSETVFGQFGFHFFLLLWASKPSLCQPFYCVIAIIANTFAIAPRSRKISQEVSVMSRTNIHPRMSRGFHSSTSSVISAS